MQISYTKILLCLLISFVILDIFSAEVAATMVGPEIFVISAWNGHIISSIFLLISLYFIAKLIIKMKETKGLLWLGFRATAIFVCGISLLIFETEHPIPFGRQKSSIGKCKGNIAATKTAIQMYNIDYKSYPPNIELLVPTYMDKIPISSTNTQLDYQIKDKKWYAITCQSKPFCWVIYNNNLGTFSVMGSGCP